MKYLFLILVFCQTSFGAVVGNLTESYPFQATSVLNSETEDPIIGLTNVSCVIKLYGGFSGTSTLLCFSPTRDLILYNYLFSVQKYTSKIRLYIKTGGILTETKTLDISIPSNTEVTFGFVFCCTNKTFAFYVNGTYLGDTYTANLDDTKGYFILGDGASYHRTTEFALWTDAYLTESQLNLIYKYNQKYIMSILEPDKLRYYYNFDNLGYGIQYSSGITNQNRAKNYSSLRLLGTSCFGLSDLNQREP